MEQIFELAGVAKGTVYYHFKGKDELFQALLIEGLNRFAGTLRAQAEDISRPSEALIRVECGANSKTSQDTKHSLGF